MPDPTHAEMNRFAAELLGWECVDGVWWAPPEAYNERGAAASVPFDFIRDLSACRPLLIRMNEEVAMRDFWMHGWDPVNKYWVCFSTLHMKRVFHSPKSEPGGCIVKAAMHIFPEGRECDD